MDYDEELPCDLEVLHPDESDAREYVVLRGYNPGCMTKCVWLCFTLWRS